MRPAPASEAARADHDEWRGHLGHRQESLKNEPGVTEQPQSEDVPD